MTCTIHCACNDPDNGNFIGTSEFVEFHFQQGELEALITCQGPDIKTELQSADPAYLQFGHLKLRVIRFKDWHGNWCWNAYQVDEVSARRAFHYLAKRKHWHCEEGPEELFAAFNTRKMLNAEEFRKAALGVNRE